MRHYDRDCLVEKPKAAARPPVKQRRRFTTATRSSLFVTFTYTCVAFISVCQSSFDAVRLLAAYHPHAVSFNRGYAHKLPSLFPSCATRLDKAVKIITIRHAHENTQNNDAHSFCNACHFIYLWHSGRCFFRFRQDIYIPSFQQRIYKNIAPVHLGIVGVVSAFGVRA